MTKNTKILFLGGGYVLSNLAKELNKDTFIITTRSSKKLNKFKELNYNAYKLDLNDKESLKDLLNQYEFEYVIDSIPHKEDLVTINNIISCINKNIKVIYLSSTGVYGKTKAELVTEETECTPLSIQGKTRLNVEELYFKNLLSITSLRLSGIYGSTRGTGISLKNNKYPYIDNGERYSNRIHVDDIVNIIKLIIDNDIFNKIYNVTDDFPSITSEVVKYYCDKFNFNFPKRVTKDEAKNMFTLLANQKISNELIKKELNYTFKYPSYKIGAGTEFI